MSPRRLILCGALSLALPAAGQPVRLQPGDLTPGAGFGSSVAIGGNGGNYLVIGAYQQGGRGAIYVYRKIADAWQLTSQRLGERGEQFGFSLAIAGDDLLVGAPHAGRCGAVYRIPSDPLPLRGDPLPLPSDCRPGDEAGYSVAAADRIIAVGIRRGDVGDRENAGRVAVSCKGGAWFSLTAPEPQAGAEFGLAVAVLGGDLLVGAPFTDVEGQVDAGAAFLFRNVCQSTREVFPLRPESPSPRAAFGFSVALGDRRAIVGAPLADKAFLYPLYPLDPPGAPQPVPGARGSQFGVSVAASGSRVAVGARYYDGRGAAFLLDRPPSESLVSAPPGAQLGYATAVTGQLLLSGAFEEDGTGAAYLLAAPETSETSKDTFIVEFEAPACAIAEGSAPCRLAIRLVPAPAAGAARAAVSGEVSVGIRSGGSASAGDFAITSGGRAIGSRLTLIPPSDRREIEIRAVDDAVAEGAETLRLRLVDPRGASLGDRSEVRLQLSDNDTPGLIVTPASFALPEGGAARVCLRLATEPQRPVMVTVGLPVGLAGGRTTITLSSADRQCLQVRAPDDLVYHCPQPRPLSFTAASADPFYQDVTAAASARLLDDDLIVAALAASLEPDGTVLHAIRLTNQSLACPTPVADLRFSLALDTPGEPRALDLTAASATAGGAAVADLLANSLSWRGPLGAGESVDLTLVSALTPAPPPTVSVQGLFRYDRNGDGTLDPAQATFDPRHPAAPGATCLATGGGVCPTPP